MLTFGIFALITWGLLGVMLNSLRSSSKWEED